MEEYANQKIYLAAMIALQKLPLPDQRIKQLDDYEKTVRKNDEAKVRINSQLKVLDIKKVFSGQNSVDILRAVGVFQIELKKAESASKSRTITELEAVLWCLDWYGN